MKFRPGDRVRLINDQNGHGKGLYGTFRQSRFFAPDKIIEFDEKQWWAHSGDGTVPEGYGWFVESINLELAEQPYDPTQQGDTEDDI
jgi:hypothetical protein